MLLNLQLTIDDYDMLYSTEEDNIKNINWNNVMKNLYENYLDLKFAEECDDEKEKMKNNDKLNI